MNTATVPWQTHALCRQAPRAFDLDIDTPDDAPDSPRDRAERYATAFVLCKLCPVSNNCHLDALRGVQRGEDVQGIRAGKLYGEAS